MIIKKIRKQIDKVLLSDHEWKKKYCPILYNYLFNMNDEQRHKWHDSTRGVETSGLDGRFMLQCFGVMSEGGFERSLSIDEYNYWLWHPLPTGWSIIANPCLAYFQPEKKS